MQEETLEESAQKLRENSYNEFLKRKGQPQQNFSKCSQHLENKIRVVNWKYKIRVVNALNEYPVIDKTFDYCEGYLARVREDIQIEEEERRYQLVRYVVKYGTHTEEKILSDIVFG